MDLFVVAAGLAVLTSVVVCLARCYERHYGASQQHRADRRKIPRG